MAMYKSDEYIEDIQMQKNFKMCFGTLNDFFLLLVCDLEQFSDAQSLLFICQHVCLVN